MLRINTRYIPIVGVVLALGLFVIAVFQYAGDVHWTRVTASMLCAKFLPDGSPNPGRALPITALFIHCASMALLFHFLSKDAETRWQRDAIQIGGIGSQVYSFLTVTPIHNLMVNITLVFTIVAMAAVTRMLHHKHHYRLAIFGVVCLVVTLSSVSLYYADAYTELWGVLQRLNFTLTTAWLFAVLLTVKPKLAEA
ncbi:MAG: DUF998 domain-containing protein [Fimbriimonadaceae bacterium]